MVPTGLSYDSEQYKISGLNGLHTALSTGGGYQTCTTKFKPNRTDDLGRCALGVSGVVQPFNKLLATVR